MTDEERAEFLEKLATSRDVRLDDIATLEEIATRLRARSEDTERLDHLEKVCTGASSSERYLPFRIYWGDGKGIRVAIDSARKRGG